MNDENTSPRALRTRSAAEMIEATSVVVPSSDVAFRIIRHFPEAHLKVRSWEEAGELPPANPQPQGPDGMRRICVIGAIGIEKGYEVLLACARDAANRRLNLRFMLVGYSCDDARLTATGRVHITGNMPVRT
jgi:glycosyltransferase involved in cell wall biosynthesis